MQSAIAFAITYLTASLSNAHEFITVPQDLQTHPDWGSFEDFTRIYVKTYPADELRSRFSTFVHSIDQVSRPTHISGAESALNRFSDMNAHEFREAVGAGCFANARQSPDKGLCTTFRPTDLELSQLPTEVDWRREGAVTPVKNQGKCGSCWSFSATGAMEGAWARATGVLTSLSEQQLLDCSRNYGNQACNGGIMEEAFSYAIQHGMCPDNEDPYEAKSGVCTNCSPSVFMRACMDVEPGNQLALQAAVARQPVSVAIEADTSTFQLYAGGVVTNPACGKNLDHGVLIVGYGEENGQLYWLVKNSWGPDWGENGYVKIARSNRTDDPGICGIGMQPAFPIAASTLGDACRITLH